MSDGVLDPANAIFNRNAIIRQFTTANGSRVTVVKYDIHALPLTSYGLLAYGNTQEFVADIRMHFTHSMLVDASMSTCAQIAETNRPTDFIVNGLIGVCVTVPEDVSSAILETILAFLYCIPFILVIYTPTTFNFTRMTTVNKQ